MNAIDGVNYPFHYIYKVRGFESDSYSSNNLEKKVTIQSYRDFLYGNSVGALSCEKRANKPSLSSYDLLMIAKGIKSLGNDNDSEDFIEIAKRIDVLLSNHFEKYLSEDRKLSQNEIKLFLVHLGILPSAREAKKIFWGLKDNWLKQIIDGCPSGSDKLVFDLGTIDRPAEPGYLDGVTRASKALTNKFNLELSFSLYKEVHRLACRHLAQPANEDQERIKEGSFRKSERKYAFTFFNTETFVVQNYISFLNYASDITKCHLRISLFEECPIYYKQFYGDHSDNLPFSNEDTYMIKSRFRDIKTFLARNLSEPQECASETQILGKLNGFLFAFENKRQMLFIHASIDVNNSIAKASKQLGSKSDLAKSSVFQDTLEVECYDPKNTQEAASVVKKSILKFNTQLKHAKELAFEYVLSMEDPSPVCFVQQLLVIQSRYQKTVVHLVGELFSELEWVQLWARAGRRTDRIVLNGLLSREGLHPVILNQSHYSICNTSENWIEYLWKGLNQYEFVAQC